MKPITGTSKDKFNCILNTVEEQMSELEERWVENFQFEEEEKMIENTEKTPRDMGYNEMV